MAIRNPPTPRTLHHSGSARVAKPAPLFFPNLHHCRPAPNGPWRLTSRSGPILPAGSRATRPIKAAAPRLHFNGGADRTRSPPHQGGGGGERPLTWLYGYRGGAALPRDTLLPFPLAKSSIIAAIRSTGASSCDTPTDRGPRAVLCQQVLVAGNIPHVPTQQLCHTDRWH